jgi:hypothetical protein
MLLWMILFWSHSLINAPVPDMRCKCIGAIRHLIVALLSATQTEIEVAATTKLRLAH